MSRSLRGQLVPIGVYIVMAVSLNLTVGISGELSLGHAGFMSVGAFSGIVAATWMESAFAMENDVVRLLLAMVVGGVFAGIAGVIIGVPVLRLRGDYLAIVTLAFGEIIRNVLNCVYISVDAGPRVFRLHQPADPRQTGAQRPRGRHGREPHLHVCHRFCAHPLYALRGAQSHQQPFGRAIMACRDSRIRRRVRGHQHHQVPHDGLRHLRGAGRHGGRAHGLNYSTVTAAKFDFNTSILVLVFVVLGGIGNIWGSIIAATLLTVLPELLRGFSDYRMLVYAVVAHTRHARHQQPDDARLLRARAAHRRGEEGKGGEAA